MWKNGQPPAFGLRGHGLERVLGPLETDVLEVLWNKGRGTAREVMTELERERPIAFNTVMTILKRLCDKGLILRSDSGVAVFSPCLSKEDLLAKVSRNVADSLVEDFGEAAIVQFVDSVQRRDPELLNELRRAIEAVRKERS